ncbi:hypothetical protein GN956_G17836 [Arapaima gigas]
MPSGRVARSGAERSAATESRSSVDQRRSANSPRSCRMLVNINELFRSESGSVEELDGRLQLHRKHRHGDQGLGFSSDELQGLIVLAKRRCDTTSTFSFI